jgi:soluble cytochrome b562
MQIILKRKPALSIILPGLVCTLLFLFSACGNGDFGEVKKMYRESNSVSARFIHAIEKADTAEKTVKALQEYNKSMTILQNQYKVYLAENPEISRHLETFAEPPAELVSEFEESEKLNDEIMDALKKVMRFLDNNTVADQIKTMEKILEDLQ